MTQKEILEAILAALKQGNLPLARTFINSKKDAPDSNTLAAVMDQAAHQGFWGIIQDICQIQGDNQPDQEAVHKILLHAVMADRLEFFQLICRVTGKNKPGQQTMDEALEMALQQKTLKHNWDVIHFILFELRPEDNHPGQAMVDKVFRHAAAEGYWGVVEKLCQPNAKNKPSQVAVDEVLLRAVGVDRLDSFKQICGMTGGNRPSKQGIEDALRKAYSQRNLKSAWAFVEFILFELKPDDAQPGQALVDEVFKYAANNGYWPTVEKLCQPAARNKPSQAAVDAILLKAVGVDRLDTVKVICGMASGNKPSKQGIENALRKAYKEMYLKNAWSSVEFILLELKPDDAQPGQALVDEVFKYAANNGYWPTVQKLCQPAARNKPSQAAVDAVLLKAVGVDRLDTVKLICGMAGENRPSKQGIENALRKAYKEMYLKYAWSTVEFILFELKSNDAQPGQALVDEVFKYAANNGYWPTVQKLCQPDVRNRPSQAAVDAVLLRAVGADSLHTVKAICGMTGENKPSQEGINNALRKAHTDRGLSNDWTIVEVICAMQSDNQPEKDYVEEAYYIAANYGYWQLINKLSQMTGNNKPDQEAVERVFVRAAGRNVINTVKVLCQLETERSPRAEAISQAFIAAAKVGGLDVIRFLDELPAEKKPDSKTLKDAFIAAALGGHVNVVKDLYGHPGLELDQALINEAVMNAASLGKGVDVLEFFYEEGQTVLPDEQTKINAFNKAITKGSYEVVRWLIKNGNLDQMVIDQGLITAVKSPFYGYLMVEFLLNRANPIVPGEAAVRTALKQIPPDVDRNIEPMLKKFLKELGAKKNKETSPPTPPTAEEAEHRRFQVAVLENDIANVKLICSQIGTNNIKLVDVKRAMKGAPSPEMKKCLQDAEKILKLHERIAGLKAYGENLQKERRSSGDGDTAVSYAEKLSEDTKSYTKDLFSNANVKPAQATFSKTLKDAYSETNNHSAEWKLWLKKIALAATVIGALISGYKNKGFFNTRTQRQTELAKIREEYAELTGEKPDFK